MHGRLGPDAMVVAPNGDVLPCQAASTIPGLEFENVRDHPLEWIWCESDAFKRFRGTDWMREPCRTCPLGRQEVDCGGCRCQALRLAGDAKMTDPVCRFSPHHARRGGTRAGAERAAPLPHDAAPHAGLTLQSPSARRTTGAWRRDTGSASPATRSMISDSSPLGPRLTARTQDRLTNQSPMDAYELASGELLFELVDAMHRGLETSLLGDEPDVVAVRLREADLGPPQ